MKFIYFLVLVTSITGASFAQTNPVNTDKIFEFPDQHRQFLIDLGKGNKMQIDITEMSDLNRFANMDSVLRVFLTDIQPLKDSLGDAIMSRRIDYRFDTTGFKKLRILKYPPRGSSFIAGAGELAALKLEQDTVNMLGTYAYQAKYTLRRAFTDYRNYRVSFFLNDIADLELYLDGRLNEKIRTLQEKLSTPWVNAGGGRVKLKADPSISARIAKGYVAGGDFVNFRISTDFQNYKHYFVPSFSAGLGLIISNSHFKRELTFSWDPHFFFARNPQGDLKTFRNDFLTLTAGHGPVVDRNPRKESHLIAIFSIAYLVKKEGDYFKENTFRIGAGRLSLFSGKTKIEPVIYFDHFFKGVTPGIRWIQSF